jgi:ferric-dicitrate binding protein FerR (iron transport regulator)
MKPEELFEKLIKNEISREEFEELLKGFDNDDIRAKYDAYLAELFEQEVSSHFDGLKDEPVKSAAKKDEKHIKSGASQSEESSKRIRHYPVAAIILLFIGTFFAVLLIISWFGQEEPNSLAYDSQANELITKSTPNRRMFRMRLEDGSFVHLNAVSKITYPQAFAIDHREIEMLGEVYFDIERDETKPFTIKVKNHDVEVLGTSFNVKAFDDDDDFSVTVESGTVRVDLKLDGVEPVVITKDQKMIFNSRSKQVQVLEVDSQNELSWRKGILKFDSTPMAQVKKTLERWYGREVIIEDEEIYELNFNGSHHNENLKSVMESIEFGLNINYTIEGNSIIIRN